MNNPYCEGCGAPKDLEFEKCQYCNLSYTWGESEIAVFVSPSTDQSELVTATTYSYLDMIPSYEQ